MIRPVMYMEMQLLHTICIIYYKERFSNRKGCISIYNLRKFLFFFVLCLLCSDHFENNSSVVSPPVIIVVQPRLSFYQTTKLLPNGIKRDSGKLPFLRQIHGTLCLSRFWRLYYFSFDSRTTVSTCTLCGN